MNTESEPILRENDETNAFGRNETQKHFRQPPGSTVFTQPGRCSPRILILFAVSVGIMFVLLNFIVMVLFFYLSPLIILVEMIVALIGVYSILLIVLSSYCANNEPGWDDGEEWSKLSLAVVLSIPCLLALPAGCLGCITCPFISGFMLVCWRCFPE